MFELKCFYLSLAALKLYYNYIVSKRLSIILRSANKLKIFNNCRTKHWGMKNDAHLLVYSTDSLYIRTYFCIRPGSLYSYKINQSLLSTRS